MKKQWSTVLLIVLALVVVIFSVFNVDPVGINFGFAVVEMPLAVILIGTLLIGVLMTVLLSTGIILKYKSEQKKLEKSLITLETEKEAEKEKLIEDHQQEIQTLVHQDEQSQKEIRDLERRIKNINASHSAQSN